VTGAAPYFYEARISWAGKRRAILKAAELPPIRSGSAPEFRGEPGLWSAENLLLASIESCLMSSFLDIVEQSGLGLRSYRSSSLARVERAKDGRLELRKVVVRPLISVALVKDREVARRSILQAMDQCAIANALGIPIQLEATVLVEERPETEAAISGDTASPDPARP
jgi:organic hydroperoxide reductase OsmC/OhrA